MPEENKKNKNTFVPRITQLDAHEFEQEIKNVLYSQLMEISNYLKPGAFNRLKPEINLVLNFLIFYYSVLSKKCTFGQELLGLKYTDFHGTQSKLYAVFNYVVPYVKNKSDYYLNKHEYFTVKNYTDKLTLLIKACSLVNSIIFLKEGKYPTVVDRLLKLRYVPVNKLPPRGSYNYMTRELLWHSFMELLSHTLPFVNYKKITRQIKYSFLASSSKVKAEKSIIYNSKTKCVVCDDSPVLPCIISKYCPHLCCYYCLKSNLLIDEKFLCPACGETNSVRDELIFFSR